MQARLIVADIFPDFISKVTTNLKQQTKSPEFYRHLFTRSPNHNDDDNNDTLHIIQCMLQWEYFKLIL